MSRDVQRRLFLLRTVPACAAGCLAWSAGRLCAQQAQGQAQPSTLLHKFDAEIPLKPTARMAFRLQYADSFIPFVLFLSKTMGKEKATELLKRFSEERSVENVADTVRRLGGNDFASLKRLFSPDSPPFRGVLTMTVAESTEKVHELKVTECLWASTFREANAGDEGYAAICYGDYAFAKALNPRIEMIRDQTLMQGHSCCNHRYLLKG